MCDRAIYRDWIYRFFHEHWKRSNEFHARFYFFFHFVRMKNRREPRQEERISTFQEGVFENFRNGKHRPVFCPRRRTNISNGAKLAMIFFTTCKLTARWIWLSSPGEHFSSPSRNQRTSSSSPAIPHCNLTVISSQRFFLLPSPPHFRASTQFLLAVPEIRRIFLKNHRGTRCSPPLLHQWMILIYRGECIQEEFEYLENCIPFFFFNLSIVVLRRVI